MVISQIQNRYIHTIRRTWGTVRPMREVQRYILELVGKRVPEPLGSGWKRYFFHVCCLNFLFTEGHPALL